jgi:hypothetical protein
MPDLISGLIADFGFIMKLFPAFSCEIIQRQD